MNTTEMMFTPEISTELMDAIDGIVEERRRQDKKWGTQAHSAVEWIAILGEEFGEASQEALRVHFRNADMTALRKELIQVAAVAVAFVEDIDRTSLNGEERTINNVELL